MNLIGVTRYSIAVMLFASVMYVLDFDALYSAIVNVDVFIFLIAAILSIIVSSIRAFYLNSILVDEAYLNLVSRISFTQFVSQIIPFKLGEAVFVLPNAKSKASELFGSLIQLRIMELTTSLFFSGIIIFYTFENNWVYVYFLGAALFFVITLNLLMHRPFDLLLKYQWQTFFDQYIAKSAGALLKEVLFFGLPICVIQFGVFFSLTLAIGKFEQPFEYTTLFYSAAIAGIIPLNLFAGIGIRQFAILGVGSIVVLSQSSDLIVYSVTIQLLNLISLFISMIVHWLVFLFVNQISDF